MLDACHQTTGKLIIQISSFQNPRQLNKQDLKRKGTVRIGPPNLIKCRAKKTSKETREEIEYRLMK